MALFLRRLFAGAGLALAMLAPAYAQDKPAAPGGAPPGFVAPDLPHPEDTNAQRARSQPGNNAPFWRSVRESGSQPGYTSLPGSEMGVLIQSMTQYPGSDLTTAGEAWRQVRNQWIIPYGAALMLLVVLALALFYWRKGALKVHEPPTGRMIERFTPFERATHWANAIAFVVLAISGLVIAFGKFILLPVFGLTLFGWLTYALKTIHNFVGPLFVITTVIMFFTFLRDNFPQRGDVNWLMKGGGMLSGKHVPSNRFNPGEKIVFWGGVLLLSTIVIVSGLVLNKLIPGIDYTRGTMQVSHLVHAIAAILATALIIGHIYLGTLGMQGAYGSMRRGYVDESWAKAHHEYWYDDVKAGRVPAQRSSEVPPAGAKPAAQH